MMLAFFVMFLDGQGLLQKPLFIELTGQDIQQGDRLLKKMVIELNRTINHHPKVEVYY
jgi:hypothetical protein